jgi:4-azaleucine resistance transporter AzlC
LVYSRPVSGFSYLDGARAVLPLAIAVGGFGIAFGPLARSAGFEPLAAVLMSATTFAGSAQFAAASVLESGGAVAAAIGAAILLNARYGPIGVSVAPVLGGPLWKRFLLAQLVVDESWAIAYRNGRFERKLLLGAGGLLYVTWVTSTAIGAFGAEIVGDPAKLGLDAAFPALFLALLWPQLRTARAIAAAAIGAALAIVLTPVVQPGLPIIAASAACLIGLRPS